MLYCYSGNTNFSPRFHYNEKNKDLAVSLRASQVEMEADRADGGYEDDDGDDDTNHGGQHGVGLPGILGSHPTTGIIL